FFAALLLGLCLSATPSHAVEPPTTAAVQSSLEALAERKLPEAEQNQIRTQLEQTLAFLAARDDSQQQLEALKTQLRNAPRMTSEAQRELTRLQASTPFNIRGQHAAASVEQLERLLSERSSQLNDWQQQLTAASSLVVTAQTRPERAQAEISANQTRAQVIGSLLKAGKENGQMLGEERRGELHA